MEEFLKNLLGDSGYGALLPLLKNEEISAFVIPKVIVSYLSRCELGRIELPFFDSLIKSDSGYSGFIKIKDVDHSFEKNIEEQIAAIVSVLLNKTLSSSLKGLDLAKLSKTIDLLIKSQSDKFKIEPPEGKLQQVPPKAPIAPVATVPAQTNKTSIKKTMMVSEKEAKSNCKICKHPRFKDGKFVGCICVKPLAKSVETVLVGSKYKLSFSSLDDDEALTIFSLF